MIIIITIIIMIIVVICIGRYLIDKDEHTALHKIRQTYKYIHIRLKKKYENNIIFLAHASHTRTHTNMRERRERIATGMREERMGD